MTGSKEIVLQWTSWTENWSKTKISRSFLVPMNQRQFFAPVVWESTWRKIDRLSPSAISTSTLNRRDVLWWRRKSRTVRTILKTWIQVVFMTWTRMNHRKTVQLRISHYPRHHLLLLLSLSILPSDWSVWVPLAALSRVKYNVFNDKFDGNRLMLVWCFYRLSIYSDTKL